MSPYRRLPVVVEPAKPEPERVKCADCRWSGGSSSVGAMTHRSCYLWSTDPLEPGDSKLAALRDISYEKWDALRKRWNFNDDGDCFGFAHRSMWVRLWEKIAV